jgi:hypothetical protein
LTFELKDLPAEGVEDGSPASVVDRVLQRLRTRGEAMTRRELNADPIVGGSVEGIRKALERLVDRGLVTSEGKASYRRYQAVTARRGVGPKSVLNEEEDCTGDGSDQSERPDLSENVPELSFFEPETDKTNKKDKKRTTSDKTGQLIAADPFHCNASEQNGHDSGGLFTRVAERSPDELLDLLRKAADTWS